jgi:hypothetical protein
MDTISVKRYFSYDVGAPTVNGTAGSAIVWLDALLVNGYNARTIQSITRSGSTATVNFATTHGYTSDQVVALSGMDQAEYNGEFRPFNVTATSFDITVTGTPVSPATGASMTAKVAPLNWTKVFSGTNKAVYKSNYSVVGCLYLRVDDTGATNALCRGYETMTDVDTGTGPFPTLAQSANGLALPKASSAGTSAASWRVFGDEALFYCLSGGSATGVNPTWNFNGSNGYSFWFGEPILSKSGDGYGTCIFGGNNTPASGIESATSSPPYLARAYTQAGGSISVNRYMQSNHVNLSASCMGALTYPQPDGSFILSGRWMLYDGGAVIRGIMPGVYHSPHPSSAAADKTVLTDFPGLPGRSLFVSATFSGGVAFDITGPWR